MNSIMLYWQVNWQVGLGISVGVCLVVYIAGGVFITRYARKKGHDICALGFVPFINVLLVLRYKMQWKSAIRKEKKARKIAAREAKEQEGTEEDAEGESDNSDTDDEVIEW